AEGAEGAKVTAARRALRNAAGDDAEVAALLTTIADDATAGEFALALVAAARSGGAAAIADLATAPGRNAYQPALALLSGERLAAVATALKPAAAPAPAKGEGR
ncbi:MAG: hypothetical protein ACYTF0_02045, partial [Planctomycetota bacterium]